MYVNFKWNHGSELHLSSDNAAPEVVEDALAAAAKCVHDVKRHR